MQCTQPVQLQAAQLATPWRKLRRQRQPLAALTAALGGHAAPHRHSLPPPLQRRVGAVRRQRQPTQRPERQQRLQPQPSLPEALAVLETSPARDIAAAGLAAFGSVCLIKIFDQLERMGVIDKKLSRKLVHTLAGPGFLLCWPLFGAEPYSRFVAMCVPALNGVRLLAIGNGLVGDQRAVMAMSRTGDPKELLRGPLYYVIVLMAVTAIYWRDSPVGFTIAALMCGGDGLADIVGRRLGGSNPLPWNPQKSWAGSIAMFAGGLAMALGLISVFTSLGYFECDMPMMVLAVAAIALVSALVESLPVNQLIDDNLSVPGVAAFLGILFLEVAVEVL